MGPGSPDLRHTDPQEEGPSGQDGAAKQARREELTGVRFKAQLRDPQGAGPGEFGAGMGGSGSEPGGLQAQSGGSSVRPTQTLLSAALRSPRVGTQPPDPPTVNRGPVLELPGSRTGRERCGSARRTSCPGLSAKAGGLDLLDCDRSPRLNVPTWPAQHP